MVHTSFGCFEGSAMVKEQASLTVVNSSCCSCALQALGVIRGTGDKQRNAPVADMFTDEAWSDACWAAGYRRMAVAFRVFGDAWRMMDARSFSLQQRLLATHERGLLCALLLQPYTLRGCAKLPLAVQGVGTKTLVALWHNGDALQHLVLHLTVRELMGGIPLSMTLPSEEVINLAPPGRLRCSASLSPASSDLGLPQSRPRVGQRLQERALRRGLSLPETCYQKLRIGNTQRVGIH